MLITLLTAMNNKRQPNIISNVFEGSDDATKPPINPPIIPNTPN